MSGDREPWCELVTYDRVVELHVEVLAANGGMASDPHEAKGCVGGSLGNAWTAELYATQDDEDARRGLIFAGYLMYYLAKNHCFGDGNKRTALAAMHEALACLGLTVEVSEDDFVAFVLGVAEGHVKSGAEVVQWIAARLVELK